MTRDEILAMEAGPKLDALVAEKVAGWRLDTFGTPLGRKKFQAWTLPDGTWRPLNQPGKFSSDIVAAWCVVEAMRSRGYTVDLGTHYGGYRVGFGGFSANTAEADTAPLAICRAALLVVLESKCSAPPPT